MERESPKQKILWVGAASGDTAVSISGQGKLEHFKISTTTSDTGWNVQLLYESTQSQPTLQLLTTKVPVDTGFKLLRLPSYAGKWVIKPFNINQVIDSVRYDSSDSTAYFYEKAHSQNPKITIAMDDDPIGTRGFPLWEFIGTLVITMGLTFFFSPYIRKFLKKLF